MGLRAKRLSNLRQFYLGVMINQRFYSILAINSLIIHPSTYGISVMPNVPQQVFGNNMLAFHLKGLEIQTETVEM